MLEFETCKKNYVLVIEHISNLHLLITKLVVRFGETGGEVSDKKKKQICLLETEMARGRKEDAILEKKMELGNVSEKNIEDEYGSKRTRTLFCPTNCEYFFLPENEGFEGYGMQGGMSFEDMVVEMKEKPRRVKKRKEGDQSGDAEWYIE